MVAGIVLPSQGERFNTETKTDPKVKKVISFAAFGHTFRCELDIPVYIHERLTTEDWDYAEKVIRERAEDLIRQAVFSGSWFSTNERWQTEIHISQFAKTAVYNQFMKYQVRAGNHEGHEVPESLA
jgi:hypothetical protein